MSARPSGDPVDSRNLAWAAGGAVLGGIVLSLGSGLGLNRPLVLVTLSLGLLSVWSMQQWRESLAPDLVDDQGDNRPGASPRTTTTPADHSSTGRPERVEPNDDRRRRPVRPGVDTGAADGAVGGRVRPGGQPHEPPVSDSARSDSAASEQHRRDPARSTTRWTGLDDLVNAERFREFQCGACGSFDVTALTADRSSGGRSTITCRRCGTATELDPRGLPHTVRVRSNPGRVAAGADRIETPRPSAHTATRPMKEQQ
ncbi:MAG: hypothetical protein AAF547_05435 [Actinomycetota bacterium]